MTTIKLHNGQQVQIKGKRPYYQDASVFTLRGFYAKEGRELPADYEAEAKRQKQIGGFEIGFILSSSILTNDHAYNSAKKQERDESVHLTVGDEVEIEGRKFIIENAPNNNFYAVEIK